ncbi:hypothetical protein [Paraliomyxa miuraensis]|uniref:hypothetical protein n=1 Tax=Paraliomyxa miuraensis TaxID=376150 RepID=UPI00225ABC28|nr:hypothetical protein [Paraliomyxa miuraensis]MCX4240022.1 hypothetical protein [Paraliomyxa miuraensis]
MATKTKAMFVTQQEFVEWVRDTQARIPGCVVFCHGVGLPIAVWQGADEEISAASRLYIAERDPSRTEPTIESLNEERIGWVQIDVPRVVDDTLRLCQVGVKSDWWNKARAVSEENRSSLRFFDKVWRVLRAHLAFPVWATNVRTGASSQYKAIGYSEGAARWYLQGGSLGQEGVVNIKYEIRQ